MDKGGAEGGGVEDVVSKDEKVSRLWDLEKKCREFTYGLFSIIFLTFF